MQRPPADTDRSVAPHALPVDNGSPDLSWDVCRTRQHRLGMTGEQRRVATGRRQQMTWVLTQESNRPSEGRKTAASWVKDDGKVGASQVVGVLRLALDGRVEQMALDGLPQSRERG